MIKKWLSLALLAGGALVAAGAAIRSSRKMDFQGRTVLITGGSRGLGLLLAKRFAQQGANLVLVARDPDELRRAQQVLENYHVRVAIHIGDVANREDCERVVQLILAETDIDVLVNDAGIIQVGPMETMGLEDYKEAIDTHFWGPLHMILAVLPNMRRRKRGRIVNICSIGGRVAVPHMLPYSASKFALVGLSEGMRAELLKDNVLVTTVCPGLMRTGSHVNAFFKGQNKLEYTLFSISNALPISSINADLAADQIIDACAFGDADLTITIQAQAISRAHGLFPGLVADCFGVLNRFLPGPGGIGEQRLRGKQSTTALSPSMLTVLADSVVARNNEL